MQPAKNIKPTKPSVAIVTMNPPGIYSGGRYHGLMLAEALADAGWDVHYVTDNLPVFWSDFTPFPAHKHVHVICGLEAAKTQLPTALDACIIVPGTREPYFYSLAMHLAATRNAHPVLVNFESPNWFNAHARTPKNEALWDGWQQVASASSCILSIAKEGTKWAKDFYTRVPAHCTFTHAYPPINTHAADAALAEIKNASHNHNPKNASPKNNILMLARFGSGGHKGSDDIINLITPAFAGHTFTVLVGTGTVPEATKTALEARCKAVGAQLQWQYQLSDVEKFKLYAQAKVLLFPSLFEGYGYPPIEARYCGCPVVAFNLPVLRETCGNDIVYAQHGNWEDFTAKTEAVLKNPPAVTGENLENLVHLHTTATHIEAALVPLIKSGTPPCYKAYTATYGSPLKAPKPPKVTKPKNFTKRLLRAPLSVVLNLTRTMYKTCKQIMYTGMLSLGLCALRGLRTCMQTARKKNAKAATICYYPKFRTQADLTNHYYRAAWYFPGGKYIKSVYFNTHTKSLTPAESPPAHMHAHTSNTAHLHVQRGKRIHFWRMLLADVILIWDTAACNPADLALFNKLGIVQENVGTTDLESKEYGTYPGTLWRRILPKALKQTVLKESHARLKNIISAAQAKGITRAAAFGTGPSIDSAAGFNFEDTFTIICNSTVGNAELVAHLNPSIICAGDAVSHFGVSTYAAKFRGDLVNALKTRENLYYFGTATFGYILALHYPEIAHKCIFIEQSSKGPTYNLLENFSAPQLDSTMNIHMLPLAATVAEDIYILGCDGKNPNADNEDFWAHSKAAQYHNLVDTGHLCHPTFDIHRQQNTYNRYQNSVTDTIGGGEALGKRYTSLRVSYIPEFSKRHLTPQWYQQHFPTHTADGHIFNPPIPLQNISEKLNA